MAKYRVLTESFIHDKLVEKGAIIEFTGEPGSNLELLKNHKHTDNGDAHGTVLPKDADDASDLA